MIEKLDYQFRPSENECIKVKSMNDITELLYMSSVNKTCKIKKIDKDYYMYLDTGEVREFEHGFNRASDLNSVRKSLSKLRDYLNTNISDVNNCRWVTLTYAENMTDTKRLYIDFKNFNKRMRYKYGNYEYVVAMEPQERGAWHCHVVMIFNDIAPFIPNSELYQIWGHGFVKIKKLDNVDNVGAYLTAYLGDLEITDDKITNIQEHVIKTVSTVDDDGKKINKRVVKGGRLHLYPLDFNLYRCSRGIKKPKIEYMSEEKAREKVSGDTLTFEKSIRIFDDEKGFEKTINYRYFNKKR